MDFKNTDIAELLLGYMEKINEVVSNELWENILLDFTKSELFTILLLYRRGETNMTQIAEYIKAPLNTATGIVSRMEKRGWVKREQSADDKRVVLVGLTKKGNEVFQNILKEFAFYGSQIIQMLTEEELLSLGNILDKVLLLLNRMKNDTFAAPGKSIIKKIPIE